MIKSFFNRLVERIGGHRKTVIITLASVAGVCLAVAVLLAIPWGGGSHFLINTVDTFLFDVEDALATANKIVKCGYMSELDIYIDGEGANRTSDLGLNIKAQGFGNGENIKERLTYEMSVDENLHRGEIRYVDGSLYFTGYDKDGGEFCVYFPVSEAFENLDASVFNPDNGSKFALPRESFEMIKMAFAEEDDDELQAELEDFANQLLPKIKKQIKIKTEKGKIGERAYTISFDTRTVNAVIDVICNELSASEALCDRMSLDDETLKGLRASLKAALSDYTLELYLVERNNLLKYARLHAAHDTGEYSDKIDLSIEIDRGLGVDSAVVYITTTTGSGNSKVTTTASVEYARVRGLFKNELTLAFLTGDEEDMRFEIEQGKVDGRYKVECFTPDSGEEPEMTMSGRAGFYGANRGYRFSIDKYKDDKNEISGLLDFYIKATDSGRRIEAPKGAESILDMTEARLDTLIHSIDYEKIDDSLWRGFTKKLNLSHDGLPIMNYSVALSEQEAIEQLFKYYHKQFGKDVQRIYYYIPYCGVYTVVDYDYRSGYKSRFYVFPEDILNTYHEVKIVNNSFVVHDYDFVEEVAETCYDSGYSLYKCNVCGCEIKKSGRNPVHTGGVNHAYFDMWYHDVGQKSEATIIYCHLCNSILKIRMESGRYAFELLADGSGIVNPGENIKHLILPDLAYSKFDLSNLKLNSEERPQIVSIRVPQGREVISKGDFAGATGLQVLWLPNSLKEIQDGAFSKDAPIHTIFFEGTEEQWNMIDLNEYKSDWADVEIIFVPDGVDSETVMTKCNE